jgi:hypothetical protein
VSVRFALAGGMAVNVWGRPRLTTDVDFAVLVDSVEELALLVSRAQTLGFLALDPRPMEFKRAWVGRLVLLPEIVGSTPEPVLVDLVRPIGRGAEAWCRNLLDRSTTVELLAQSTPIVQPEDLVLFKLLVENDRGYDMADAQSVVDDNRSRLDLEYLIRTARSLGVRGKLRRLGV